MRESKIEKYFVEQVHAIGGTTYKLKFQDRRGAPDRIVVFPHRWSGLVELKAPSGTLEKHQERLHKELKKAGLDVLVIYTIEGVNRFMRKYGGSDVRYTKIPVR